MAVRIGVGYDLHRLTGGRPFLLGGVLIPYPQGPAGHSDGDALLHALIDAMLGAAALGDIGTHFPSSDSQWRDVASTVLLEKTRHMIEQAGFSIGNVDATIILERPMLAPHLPKVRESIASTLGIDVDKVSVKAKTNEGMDALGRGHAVAAHAVVLLEHA